MSHVDQPGPNPRGPGWAHVSTPRWEEIKRIAELPVEKNPALVLLAQDCVAVIREHNEMHRALLEHLKAEETRRTSRWLADAVHAIDIRQFYGGGDR